MQGCVTLKRTDTSCTLEGIRQNVIVARLKLLYLTSSEVTDINDESLALEACVLFCIVLFSFTCVGCQLNALEFERVT